MIVSLLSNTCLIYICIVIVLYLCCICFVFLLYLYGDCSRVYTAHPPPFLEVAEPGSLPHKPWPTWDNQTLSNPCHSHQGPPAHLQAPQTNPRGPQALYSPQRAPKGWLAAPQQHVFVHMSAANPQSLTFSHSGIY